MGWISVALPVGMLIVLAVAVSWRRPVIGWGVLVFGLAFHNAVLMILLNVATPALVVRALQGWKEVVLIVLIVKLGLAIRRSGRLDIRGAWTSARLSHWSVRALDASALAFSVLLIAYFLAPLVTTFGGETTLIQRLLSLRVFILLPLLYALGRAFGMRDRAGGRIAVALIAGAGAAVALIGLVEIWFVPTRVWLNLGVPQLTALQGYAYQGPGGLPENFFQSTPAGLGLRRMVSTYISPLGIAYTGLLVVPMIVGTLLALKTPRHWAWIALALVLLSVALSVTRLALLCLLVEAVLWVLIARRPTAVVAALLSIAAVATSFYLYPHAGPLVTFDLADVRPPAGASILSGPSGAEQSSDPGPTLSPAPSPPAEGPDIVGGILTQEDASIQAHIAAVRDGLVHAVDHPFGVGLGSTMQRFGTATGPAESALLGLVGEIGLIGGALFMAMYAGVVLVALRLALRPATRPVTDLAMLVAVGGIGLAPVVLTSAVWGDFSVTFLFWWAAGACVTAFDRSHRQPGALDEPSRSVRAAA